MGPLDQPALLRAMRWHAFLCFTTMRDVPFLSRSFFRTAVVPWARFQPQLLFRLMLTMMPGPDYRVLSRPAVGNAIIASLAESVRNRNNFV